MEVEGGLGAMGVALTGRAVGEKKRMSRTRDDGGDGGGGGGGLIKTTQHRHHINKQNKSAFEGFD